MQCRQIIILTSLVNICPQQSPILWINQVKVTVAIYYWYYVLFIFSLGNNHYFTPIFHYWKWLILNSAKHNWPTLFPLFLAFPSLSAPGCKIKALRAKTNTYIKTPVRGEEPVFIVTGRREDVEMAKREIVSAAEYFSMIRASRCKAGATGTGAPGTGGAIPGPPHLPGQTTIQVWQPQWEIQ